MEWLDLTTPGAEWVSWPDLGTSRCCWPQVSDGRMSGASLVITMSQVGMLENNIVVIGGEKRPSNTLETFDPKVSCLVVSIIETKGFTD